MFKHSAATLRRYNARLEGSRQYGGVVAVHIGLHKNTKNLPPQWWSWVTDGDSWEVWGEDVSTDPYGVQHVVILTLHPEELIHALVSHHNNGDLTLEPFTEQPNYNHNGLLWAVTEPDNWSEQTTNQYLELHGEVKK